MTIEEDSKISRERVDKAIAGLGEHFDHIQIFVSKLASPDDAEGQKIYSYHAGNGNWLGRYGQVREWLIYEEERIRNAARRSEEP